MTYTLTICISIVWGMCSMHSYFHFKTKEDCLAAQKVVQESNAPPAWLVCAPKEKP